MITSTSNDTVKHVTLLVKNAKARRKEGLFVVEGDRIAREIPKGMLVQCFVTEEFAASQKENPVFDDADVTVVSADVFKKMSDTQNPQGILCTCRKDEVSLDGFLAKRAQGSLRLLILEGIQDPGNLGTMVRSAEAAGFDAVIADMNTADVFNPKVIRSTMGSIFRVPVIYTDDLPEAVDRLRSEGVTVYAAHLKGEARYSDTDYAKRIAFMIGNEGNGLSDGICKKADMLVKIPMYGKVESLNAAVAASLLMFASRGR